MPVINTNVNSLVAQSAINQNSRSLGTAMQQLSTGKRINSAADDAAGLSISSKMTAQVRGLNQAVRNANDAVSMIQTAEGASQTITDMLQRMRELAVQSANGTNGSTERTALDNEFQDLRSEITRIASNTEWNNTKLLDGNLTAVNYQIGAKSSQTITVTFQGLNSTVEATVTAAAAGLTTITLATAAITGVDTAIDAINTFRSQIGSKINRLNYAADNLTNIATNTAASRSRILDADYATATTELARAQIIQQAATAMLAQANQQPQSVLSLLK